MNNKYAPFLGAIVERLLTGCVVLGFFLALSVLFYLVEKI